MLSRNCDSLGSPLVEVVTPSGPLPTLPLAEAIAVGLSLIARTGDAGLWRAAGRAARKLQEAAPGTRKLVTSSWGVGNTACVDISQIRLAIRRDSSRADYVRVVYSGDSRNRWPSKTRRRNKMSIPARRGCS